jgi:hypothetical protein
MSLGKQFLAHSKDLGASLFTLKQSKEILKMKEPHFFEML